jgi:ribosomal-protein-alanine N-acetyltransferase
MALVCYSNVSRLNILTQYPAHITGFMIGCLSFTAQSTQATLATMNNIELSGAKIRVVLPDPSEAAIAAQYFRENRQHLSPTNPALPKDFYTDEFWAKKLTDAVSEFENDRSVRLFIKDLHQTTQFIGSINFTQIFRGPFQACYLGYSISKAHEGQGKMLEALHLSIKFMFEKRHIHRIMANYLSDNKRSARVLSKLGFRIDGTSPDYLYINGAWREHVLTSLTSPSWTPRTEDIGLFS